LADERRRIVILCGHYEGVDERVRLTLAPEEISLGDYVLTGGELPALVLIDAAARLVPGVLGDPSSVLEESFADALLEYPHYTRPAEIGGIGVPDVLLSGHHETIRLWRRKQALRNTYLRRPDLLKDRVFTKEDQQLLDELMSEGLLTAPTSRREEG
jgi:tRNA (guanine37-N1)-methyltransferase